jgi:hypothetical protein
MSYHSTVRQQYVLVKLYKKINIIPILYWKYIKCCMHGSCKGIFFFSFCDWVNIQDSDAWCILHELIYHFVTDCCITRCIKVKQCLYRPGHEGGKFFQPYTLAAFIPQEIFLVFISLEAESTPGQQCGQKDCVTKNFQRQNWDLVNKANLVHNFSGIYQTVIHTVSHTSTKCHIDTVISPDDGHSRSTRREKK